MDQVMRADTLLNPPSNLRRLRWQGQKLEQEGLTALYSMHINIAEAKPVRARKTVHPQHTSCSRSRLLLSRRLYSINRTRRCAHHIHLWMKPGQKFMNLASWGWSISTTVIEMHDMSEFGFRIMAIVADHVQCCQLP